MITEKLIAKIPRMPMLKIPIMGEAVVGKTSIANVLSGGGYIKDYEMTIGVDVFTRFIKVKGNTYKVYLWDIAGQKRFSALRRIFYRGSHAGLFVFDITRKETFLSLESWINDFLSHHPNVPILIVGNKIDLEEHRDVPSELGEALAKKYSTFYIETSAKTGENIELAFKMLIAQYIKKYAVISL